MYFKPLSRCRNSWATWFGYAEKTYVRYAVTLQQQQYTVKCVVPTRQYASPTCYRVCSILFRRVYRPRNPTAFLTWQSLHSAPKQNNSARIGLSEVGSTRSGTRNYISQGRVLSNFVQCNNPAFGMFLLRWLRHFIYNENNENGITACI